MELVRILVLWLAAAFVVAGLLQVANLAMFAGSSRREEAEMMRLVGAGTWTIWLRTGLVIALPTVIVILITAALVASAVPTIAKTFLPAEAAAAVAAGPVLRTGLLLAAAAAFIATAFSLLAVWKAARK